MSRMRHALTFLLAVVSTSSLTYTLYYMRVVRFTRTTLTGLTAEVTTSTAPLTPFQTPPSTTASHFQPDRYVTFGRCFDDGRGLGNQIFNFAVVLYVSELTGRVPALLNLTYFSALETTFNLQVSRYNGDLCPCQHFGEAKSLAYDSRVEDFATSDPESRSIYMVGFYQSWKYTRSITKRLRQNLVFHKKIRDVADQFLADNVPNNWIPGFLRVGMHVRRGDVVTDKSKVDFGYTTPNETYFEHAMRYIVDRYQSRVQFIVASNDLDWCRQHLDRIVAGFNSTASVNLVYSVNHSPAEDMAILASCDHVIMSTGTYGWWAAWLSGGTTIYYADWPREGTTLWNQFKKEDFFPPEWIGIV